MTNRREERAEEAALARAVGAVTLSDAPRVVGVEVA